MAIQVVLGRWTTRNNRLVQITSRFQVDDPPAPGSPKTVRTVWGGTLYQADGKTIDSPHSWEADGRFRTPQAVANMYDLVQLIEADPLAIADHEGIEEVFVTAAETENESAARVVDDVTALLLPHLKAGETPVEALKRILEMYESVTAQKDEKPKDESVAAKDEKPKKLPLARTLTNPEP